MYEGCCQICKSVPFKGQFGSIAEGHHIDWLCRGGKDTLDNLILLCPNHHAAIHAANPAFDRSRLEFRFGPKRVPIG
jgi:5-methylcytosine-specific restriction enzyme A